ncbi:MAG TPA: serine/threonine-protein kinase [Polyangiaceae bacterium]
MSDERNHPASSVPAPADDPWLGKVLAGRYRLDVLLGSGAMGRVYRAEHVLMHKRLAVKIMNPEHTKSAELVARFEREATAAANIEHPNVVAATDFGKLDDGTVYLALELVEGRNLRAEVAQGALDGRRALHIARQIAAGLAAAHARNIVHRDLKPENVVLVEKDGDPDFVKILDFGIAKLEPESGKSPLTKVGVVLGTLDYMAPEQALGQPVDHRADLYALGAVTYEMLCGACPYEGESSAAIVGLQLTKAPPSLRERAPTLAVPGAVEALVMKLLAKDKNARPQSAAAVGAELERLLASVPKGPSPSPPRPSGARPVEVKNKPTFLPTDPLPAFTFPPLEEASKKLTAEVKKAVAAREPVPPRIAPASKPPSVPVPKPPSVPVSKPPSPFSKAPAAPVARAPVAPSPVSSSPSVDALLADLPGGATPLAPTAKAPAEPPATEARDASVDSLLAKAPPVLDSTANAPRSTPPRVEFRARATQALDATLEWIDDHRRFLPRFIKRPLRRVPSGALLVGVLALVFVLLVTLVLWASDSEPGSESLAAATASAPATVGASSAPPVTPTLADDGAGKAITRAEAELGAGNWSGVVVALDAALAANPAVNRNERVATMLAEAARHEASASAAFRLLSGPMGARGAEVLYDLAAHPKTPNDVRLRAGEWLATERFQSVAPAPLAIAGKLRATRGCSEKKALLDAAATAGDRRALEYLKTLAVPAGCGRRGRDDCYPCLREDGTLTGAIAKLEQRVAGSKAP